MDPTETAVVTGGLSYIGKHITQRLVAEGQRVVVLTGHPNRPNPFGDHIRIAPFHFDDRAALVGELSGATTLFNTYWVRFDRGDVSFDRALRNIRRLIDAAKEGGIRRIVHVSVSNPSEDSPFPYFRGKAAVERMIGDCGLSYVIIRPTLVYGGEEEILVNNIAWLLRRFPVFALPSQGGYRLQPVHVEEVAELAVEQSRRPDRSTVDAAGPEIMTFETMVRLIAAKLGRRPFLIPAPPGTALWLLKIVGLLVNDVVLTADELGALKAELLVSNEPPRGKIRLGEWLDGHAGRLGLRYASELERHYR
jgi:uncharacterized protein YbjT (DUF2867 family)